MNEYEAPFPKDEAILSEATFFDELSRDGEVTLFILKVSHCQSEKSREASAKSDKKACSSTNPS